MSLVKNRGVVPQALDNSPIVRPYEIEYIVAFSILNDRRGTAFGLQPIPLSEIVAYLALYPTHDTELFIYLISAMDDEYIKLKAKQHGG